MALKNGFRGLPGGKSLTRLLGIARDTSELSEDQIRMWAEEWKATWGVWPNLHDFKGGPPGHGSWGSMNHWLAKGGRGLPGGSSLTKLTEPRDSMSVELVLAECRRYQQAHGEWPTVQSGECPTLKRETFAGMNWALREGYRGLPGGSSLRAEMEKAGLVTPIETVSVESILNEARAFLRRHARLPTCKDEPFVGYDRSLRRGNRGLPGGSSLDQELATAGLKAPERGRAITVDMILQDVHAYRERHGDWPTVKSPGFRAYDNALRYGLRGLPGGSSIAQLLVERGLKKPVTNCLARV